MTVLFFCIGAAKAGTSWLFEQLGGHPECHFRAIKELHYFDAIDGGRLDRELRRHRERHAELLGRLAAGKRAPSPAQARLIADRSDWLDVLAERREDRGAYMAYLEDGAGQARVIGEMTPAYSLLSAERLGAMSQMTADVRFLYMLRDPVERLWSHVRMIAARRDSDGRVTARRTARILERTFGGLETEIAKRSDYAGALERLARAVPGPRLLVDVFEEIVSGAGFVRICDFLGIARMTPRPAPVHAGQPLAMTGAQRMAAAAWLAPQYDAAQNALGRMPESWCREG